MARNYETVLVAIDSKNGQIARYALVDKLLLTHAGEAGGPVEFTQSMVDSFMHAPPESCRVHRDKPDPNPPTGGTPVAMAIAA